jgi:hypothetical protein
MMRPPADEPLDRSRRNFARNLLGLWGMFQEGLDGAPQLSLSDLGSVPDHVLAEMVPVWRDQPAPEIREDGLYVAAPDGIVTCAHAFAPHERAMVSQYACGRNIQTIADTVAAASGIPAAVAFEVARELFVKLCRQGLCHPAAAHV